MSNGKQFTLYSHTAGPNGWKVAFILKELGFTYESVYFDFMKGEQKAPEFLKINPNGRIPAIIDHLNNDFIIWESNAIMLYLIDRYDKENKFGVTDEADKYYLLQWLFFQASGQGPYFGQLAWFKRYHFERLPSAVERYTKEVYRVWGVLDGVLANSEWLVGNKLTIADLSFITWTNFAVELLADQEWNFEKDFPHVYAWHYKMIVRPAVAEVLAVKAELAQKK